MISQKRALGQFDTPLPTVRYMVESALSHLNKGRDMTGILDPSTGDGIFIKELLNQGIHPEHLYAYDVDSSISTPMPEIHFANQDFLKIESTQKFDAIIGNPPYKSKRESVYFKENKRFLTQQFKEVGIPNLYVLFIYKGLQMLKDYGVLSMIVQDSFLTNVYYKQFREYLLTHTEIKEIILAPRRLFHKRKADVRTAILTLVKKPPSEVDAEQGMKLIDRQFSEHYHAPPAGRMQILEQKTFQNLPGFNYAVNVPSEILNLFQNGYTSLGSVVKGGTGVSTGNDRHFLSKPEEISSEDKDWIPFYKNGGVKDAWYYRPKYYIHKNWRKEAEQHSQFTVRNPAYFYKEGITCSSMGIEFSAAYLPPGSLFGVNANLFTENQEDLYYILGLLNSSLTKYLLRKVLNRTNMITAGYIKKLPYIEPEPNKKQKIAALSSSLVNEKRKDPTYNDRLRADIMDELIFDVYGISFNNRSHVKEFCTNIFEWL
ncbi:BREX-1 system adenine-specific DNA-methyltransferase PglX [Halobacillus salinarum]|uniref:site-specific DNA-methyltransferase (adenine-specific) n=1 Tax=Halobacillus salinarum TaxID=2932257 RepID=A0ABY4EL54_9BACI|nr:N-6 DNA methylase [Halobacillus salinarum]UOQ45202.1 BREX-1 system adenine-specific DNA-methyltransferase PglX [Halobacillus salinarum]